MTWLVPLKKLSTRRESYNRDWAISTSWGCSNATSKSHRGRSEKSWGQSTPSWWRSATKRHSLKWSITLIWAIKLSERFFISFVMRCFISTFKTIWLTEISSLRIFWSQKITKLVSQILASPNPSTIFWRPSSAQLRTWHLRFRITNSTMTVKRTMFLLWASSCSQWAWSSCLIWVLKAVISGGNSFAMTRKDFGDFISEMGRRSLQHLRILLMACLSPTQSFVSHSIKSLSPILWTLWNMRVQLSKKSRT